MKKQIFILIIVLFTGNWAISGELDLSQRILDTIKNSIGVIETSGYETHVDDLQSLDSFGMRGWMYVSMSVVNAREKKAEVPFRVITNGQYVIPMLGAIIRTDTHENIILKKDIVENINLPDGGTKLFGNDNAENRVTVFTDIFCDACKGIKEDILEFIEDAGYTEDQVAVFERYAPIGKERMFISQMYEVIRKMDISPSLKKDLLAYLSDDKILEQPSKEDILKAFLTQIEGMPKIREEFEKRTKTDDRVARDILLASKIGVKAVPFTVVNSIGIKGYNKETLFDHLEKIDKKKGEADDK